MIFAPKGRSTPSNFIEDVTWWYAVAASASSLGEPASITSIACPKAAKAISYSSWSAATSTLSRTFFSFVPFMALKPFSAIFRSTIPFSIAAILLTIRHALETPVITDMILSFFEEDRGK